MWPSTHTIHTYDHLRNRWGLEGLTNPYRLANQFLATVSSDETLKIWDPHEDMAVTRSIELIHSKELVCMGVHEGVVGAPSPTAIAMSAAFRVSFWALLGGFATTCTGSWRRWWHGTLLPSLPWADAYVGC
jgi:hypothetical protein